jgi:hypothetical protein
MSGWRAEERKSPYSGGWGHSPLRHGVGEGVHCTAAVGTHTWLKSSELGCSKTTRLRAAAEVSEGAVGSRNCGGHGIQCRPVQGRLQWCCRYHTMLVGR